MEAEDTTVQFSEEQEALVKEGWQVLQQRLSENSLRFFTLILQISPSAKSLFYYLRDEDEVPQNNPQFESHATKVLTVICEMVIQMRENKEPVVVDTTLDTIASIHHKRRVSKYHFPIMKAALLRTVKEAVGDEKWSSEMEEAWRVGYDEVSQAILDRMPEKEATIATPIPS